MKPLSSYLRSTGICYSRLVIRTLIFCCGLALCGRAPAQEPEVDPADLIQSASEFLQENVDDSVWEALGVDAGRAQQFLVDLQRQFEATYVFDLAALREPAAEILPLLEQYEETEPFAIWLKTRLDYFEVARKLRSALPPAETNAVRLPNPSPQTERKAWIDVTQERPTPPLAFKQVAQLKKIFADERVPPELVWLAEVESSFDPKARSPFGAAGLFQLMPVTARSLNLSVGLLRDERFHPEKNARAAAQYLRQLYARFGDWRLTLAAYNAGESRVAALLKKHNARTFDEIAHRLPAETQMYVPKVEAVLKKREGRSLADLKMPK